MLNAEKYKDEIKTIIEQALKVKEKGAVNCKINSLTGVGCGNHAGCNDCKLKALIWLLEEYKEPILTDEEKVIVKDIINALKPFNLKFTHITKNGFSPEKKEYLSLIYDKDDKYIWVELPKFKRGEKFVGMELGKAYTLEDLGL